MRGIGSAEVAGKFKFPAIGGGFEKSIAATPCVAKPWNGGSLSRLGDLTGFPTDGFTTFCAVGVDASLTFGAFGGRPLRGLVATSVSALRYAGFTSPQARHSTRSEPSLLTPTLILSVLLVGLDKISKGPLKLGWRPVTLCCFV